MEINKSEIRKKQRPKNCFFFFLNKIDKAIARLRKKKIQNIKS